MYTKSGVFHLIIVFYHSFSYNCLHLDTCIDQLTKEVLRQISANRGSQWKTLMHNLHVILHFNPRYHKVNLSWNRNLIRKVFWLKERSHCVVVSVYKKSCLSCVSLFPRPSGWSEPVQGQGVNVMCGLCRHAWVVNAFDVQILIN